MSLAHEAPSGYRSRTWSTWRVARGCLALLALVGVLAGVPVALLEFTEWPITGVPSWDQIADFPAVVTEDSTIVAMFVVGLWIAWVAFAVCVVVEVAGEIRGRAAARVPAAGPLQHAARGLVASVAMMFGTLGSLTPSGGASSAALHAGALPSAARPAAVVMDDTTETSSLAADQQSRSADAGVHGEAQVRWGAVYVEHGDSAWELAERHYGDGAEWTRLWEDNRRLLQPDGRAWTKATDPIEPGWVLRIRSDGGEEAGPGGRHAVADASGTEVDPSAPEPPRPAAPTAVTVQPGDSFWRIAEAHLEDQLGRPVAPSEVAPYWLRFVDANQDRLVEPGNPDLLYPGQQVVLPAIHDAAPPGDAPAEPSSPSAREPASEPPEAPPDRPQPPEAPPTSATTEADRADRPDASAQGSTEASTPAAHEGSRGPHESEPAADDQDPPWGVIGTLSGLGVALAVGVTRAVDRRRRRRNHRSPTTAPRPSAQPDVHLELIDAADEDTYALLRLALRHLATGVADLGASCRARIVQHGADHIDVLLDTPTPDAPAGWRSQADGAIWTCDPAQLTSIDDDRPAATPLLVTLGQPDHEGQLYLDLEAEGVLSLTGDRDVARDVARAIITELASSPLADAAQIVVVGDLGTPAIARLDRVTVAGDWEAAAENLYEWAEQSHDALVRNGWANGFVARAHHPDHDALLPLVVVTDQAPSDEDVSGLQDLEPRTAVLVVVGDDLEGATVIDCAPGRLTLPALGLTCTPQALDVEHVDAITELLDDAEDPAGEQLQLLPDDPTPLDATADTSGPNGGGPYQDPPYDILVRVLGDITIEGLPRRLPPKQAAVLTYIALHRTVSADRLGDRLWPAPTPSRNRLVANTVSACRTAIGVRHLPLADDGIYRAGPRLLTDLDLFQARLEAATRQPRDLALETLRGALDLVRGPIFTYRGGKRSPYGWVSVENWISTWELKITALARELAGLYLAAGDTQQAVEVAQHAQQIVPTDTELTELLMRAHASNGDRVAVRRVYHEHLEALAQLDLDDPAESTADLYDQLRSSTN